MDNLRVITQVCQDIQAEKELVYNKLSRLLSNLDLEASPKIAVRRHVENIADIEKQQEVALFFKDQIESQIREASSKKEEVSEDAKPEEKDEKE